MKRHFLYPIIVTLFLTNCTKSDSPLFEKKFKSLVENEHCSIQYYYPYFHSGKGEVNAATLNEILEKMPGYIDYTHRCGEKQGGKKIIRGDYRITLETKEKISVEFITQRIRKEKSQIDTLYHSLVFFPQKVNEKDHSYLEEIEKAFPEFDKGVLYEYVRQYNQKNNQRVNLAAYESGSSHAILWGWTKESLILYVGGEGEGFGKYKILIPKEALNIERDKFSHHL
ncbi:MAG: hypothetical protein K1X92_08630 [Bacteroidia bacterium]|nr:hypothetical protein [Bacteroidia bacterium]